MRLDVHFEALLLVMWSLLTSSAPITRATPERFISCVLADFPAEDLVEANCYPFTAKTFRKAVGRIAVFPPESFVRKPYSVWITRTSVMFRFQSALYRSLPLITCRIYFRET